VEDDDATAYLFQIALREAGVQPQIFRATDGEQALAFLSRAIPYDTAPVPDVVLLDLNLPKVTGLELLRRIRQRAELEGTRVYVFSSSEDPHDKAQAMAAGATGYLHKGMSLDAFVGVAKTVCSDLNSL
jgi:CheY-like chemotaxis protein